MDLLKQITFRVDADEYVKIQTEASNNKLTVAEQVRRMLNLRSPAPHWRARPNNGKYEHNGKRRLTGT